MSLLNVPGSSICHTRCRPAPLPSHGVRLRLSQHTAGQWGLAPGVISGGSGMSQAAAGEATSASAKPKTEALAIIHPVHTHPRRVISAGSVPAGGF